ncbi:citryl-CoA lyase [Patescibacteria group bacterium]|nr:citryl-CoA lyase [Patescibacteria group bacterium]MBP9709726.1 citryl-CoA lyase [Patescibacteria group bacterium]
MSFGSIKDGEYQLRDVPVSRLMQEQDLVSVLCLAWLGRLPTEAEKPLLNACLIASIDHGQEPPSAHVTRRVASCGKPVADAVAAGLLTLGPRHGNAATAAGQWVQDAVKAGRTPAEVVEESLANKKRLSGIGHPEYTIDPRTTTISALAKTHLPATTHLVFALEVSRLMTERKGSPLPLNVDGAIGSLMADLEWPLAFADAIFLVARTMGLVAHAWEEGEATAGGTYKRG